MCVCEEERVDLSICWKGREKNNPRRISKNHHVICCQNHLHTSATVVRYLQGADAK